MNRFALQRLSDASLSILVLFCMIFLLFGCTAPGSVDNNLENQYDNVDENNSSQNRSEELFIDANDSYPSEESLNSAEAPELPRIALYGGVGSWDINVLTIESFLEHYNYHWTLIDEMDIVANDQLHAEFDLIWFPGGFAAEYKNLISNHANISSFVEGGGGFIGSCAGAYYAADILRWTGEDHSYPLSFFPGKAVGPLSGEIAWGEIGTLTIDDQAAANETFPAELPVYYFDGPYFAPYNEEEIVVLARYQVNNLPAVIAGQHGNGKYLLFGPHPELGGYTTEGGQFDFTGGGGAQWPWLHSLISWYLYW